MTGPLDLARRFWDALTGRSRRVPPVIVHDPRAAGPRDLDDVFQDPDVHTRVGSVIAESALRSGVRRDHGATDAAPGSSEDDDHPNRPA
jgi:hypothetical protein